MTTLKPKGYGACPTFFVARCSEASHGGTNGYESVGDIQTQQSAKTMAFDPKTKRLFLSAAEMEPTTATNGKRVRMRPK